MMMMMLRVAPAGAAHHLRDLLCTRCRHRLRLCRVPPPLASVRRSSSMKLPRPAANTAGGSAPFRAKQRRRWQLAATSYSRDKVFTLRTRLWCGQRAFSPDPLPHTAGNTHAHPKLLVLHPVGMFPHRLLELLRFVTQGAASRERVVKVGSTS